MDIIKIKTFYSSKDRFWKLTSKLQTSMSLIPKPDKNIKEKKTTDQLPLWPLKQLSLTNNSKNNPKKITH